MCYLLTEHVDCYARYEEMVTKCQVLFVFHVLYCVLLIRSLCMFCAVTTVAQGGCETKRIRLSLQNITVCFGF